MTYTTLSILNKRKTNIIHHCHIWNTFYCQRIKDYVVNQTCRHKEPLDIKLELRTNKAKEQNMPKAQNPVLTNINAQQCKHIDIQAQETYKKHLGILTGGATD